MLEYQLAGCSERGGRPDNEDALAMGRAGSLHYAVLADGAGGHARGAEASRRVADGVEQTLRRTSDFVPRTLTQALLATHSSLQRMQSKAHGAGRMHSTVVVLWLDACNGRAIWSHVGDSRLYRLRYGAVERLTVDDSVVQRMLDGGILTPKQAKQHPLKNQLLAAIGMQDGVEPHTLATAESLEDGDAFLLCSDGWWSQLDDADMTSTFAEASTPEDWLHAMRGLIEERGANGHDNFSAIAVWADDPEESTRAMPEDTTTPTQ